MSSGIEAYNLHPDPRCLKQRPLWKTSVQADAEKWRYELAAGETVGGVLCWSPLTTTSLCGHVLFARIRSDTQAVFDNLKIEYGSTIAKQGEWIAASIPDNANGSIMIRTTHGPFVLEQVGCYTPDDWEKLYDAYQKGAITYPWVAGPRDATAAGEKGPWKL